MLQRLQPPQPLQGLQQKAMKLTQEMVEEWIAQTTGIFYYRDIMDGQVDKVLYNALRSILNRAKEKGLIAPVPNHKDGWWRKVDSQLKELEWWNSPPIADDTVILPLEMNKYCKIPRPAVILVAGLWNAGKSAFCSNMVVLNQDKWAGHLDLFVSEAEQLLDSRFKHLGVSFPPKFKTYTRMDDFADVIQKESLTVIDYLRTDMEQSYAVAQRILEISKATVKNNGVTVIAMQKPPNRTLAYGGDATAWEPALYVAMETTGNHCGYARFAKIKIVRGYGGIDPYKLRIDYRIEYGAKFTDVRERIVEE